MPYTSVSVDVMVFLKAHMVHQNNMSYKNLMMT